MSLEKFLKVFRSSILIISGSLLVASSPMAAQPIGLKIEQGAWEYDVLASDSLVLKPRAFKYLVSFPIGKDIRLSQSYSDSLYNKFKQGHIARIPYWGAHCMAEESYNSDKEILLSSDSWSCWFYDKQVDFHRLDAKSIRIKENTIMGKKSVITIFDVDAKKRMSIRNAYYPIYLVVALEGKKEGEIAYYHCCKIIFQP